MGHPPPVRADMHNDVRAEHACHVLLRKVSSPLYVSICGLCLLRAQRSSSFACPASPCAMPLCAPVLRAFAVHGWPTAHVPTPRHAATWDGHASICTSTTSCIPTTWTATRCVLWAQSHANAHGVTCWCESRMPAPPLLWIATPACLQAEPVQPDRLCFKAMHLQNYSSAVGTATFH